MAELTVFASAGDGDITALNNSSWAVTRAGNSGLSVDATDDNGNCYIQRINANSYYIRRLYFPFDTSALGAGATITAVDFDIYYENSGVTGMSGTEYGIIEGDMASAITLVAGDWEPVSFTRLSTDKAQSVFSSAGYYTYSLNAAGLAAINKTGITKICLSSNWDIDNNQPSIASASFKSFRFSEYGGTGSDPKLTITYSGGDGGVVQPRFKGFSRP